MKQRARGSDVVRPDGGRRMTPSVLTATPAFLWTQRSQREDAKVAKKEGKLVLGSFAFFASFFAPLASKNTLPGHSSRPGNRKAA